MSGMDVNIVGANLDVAGNVKASLPDGSVPERVGALRFLSENDDGSLYGSPLLRGPETSQDFRLRVGTDTVVFNYSFNATAQNISLWKHAFLVMTMTQSAGFLNVNAAGTSVTSGQFAYLQSWKYFNLIGSAPMAIELVQQFDRTPTANEVYQIGLGVPTGAAECVDGVWFEYTSAGLVGCMRYNSGTTTKTAALPVTVPVNTNAKFAMVVGVRGIDYWYEDQFLGSQLPPAAQAQPFLSTSLPLFIQKYNNGTVGSSPNMIPKVGQVTVSVLDIPTNQTWAAQMSSMGLGLQQLDGGSATSPQIQWANTTLPTAAAATNTTAALGAFLGGIFQMNAPVASTTDLIVSSYQNPIGGVNQTPRTMKLRGIKIDCVNGVVAVGTTATVFAVAVAWGGTSLTLAATESTTFQTATVKLRRVQPIGVISFPLAAAVGAQATGIQFDFEAPLVINPGEFVQVIVKCLVGTATATETFQWIVSPNAYHD